MRYQTLSEQVVDEWRRLTRRQRQLFAVAVGTIVVVWPVATFLLLLS